MTIAAQYPGVCTECGGPITPGQTIERVGTVSHRWAAATMSGDSIPDTAYRHSPACPPTRADLDDQAALAAPRCGRCGLNHPGEC